MSDAQAALRQLAERFWQFQRFEFPLTAFMAGQPNDDPTMFREAPADAERRAAAAGSFLDELARIPAAGLGLQDRATHRMLARELHDLQQTHATLSHLKPWLLPIGPEFNTLYFANLNQIGDVEQACRYVDRLATLPDYFRDVQASMREGLRQGLRYPRVVLTAALDNLLGAAGVKPEASAWFGPFLRLPAALQAAVAEQAARALQVVDEHILPALLALHACMRDELLPVARCSLSCHEDPQGAACYTFWARHFTTLADASPEAIHALGLSEVARLDAELRCIAARAGFADDLPGYRRYLSDDPQFIAPSAESLRERLEVTAKRIDGMLPRYFGRLPRISYGVQSIPLAASERMPPAYAQPNPADGSSAGVFWISSLPDKAPSYLHVPLALHEGWPGHLMHMALMQEMTELPRFRRANFNKYSAFLEGWALYCETLGIDMGLYDTPHQHFGRLDMEMWRACRLVVDTGIHLHHWTREQAMDYMLAHLSLSRATVESEVDRYIAMPGQALGYQIGNLKFRELRARAEVMLGERFNLRQFHDLLMAVGPVTLPVLDEWVSAWLQQQTGVSGHAH